MPLTNAPDDSEYVAYPELTDAEYLRKLADAVSYNIQGGELDAKRLVEIADYLDSTRPSPDVRRIHAGEFDR